MSVIVGFEGRRGDGKTLAMIACLLRAYKMGQRVYSNVGTKFPYQPLTIDALLDYSNASSGFQNAAMAVDEIHVWLDSRMHGSKRNRIVSYLITQTRKRNVDFYYTTQHFHQVEKRVRDNTDIFIRCVNQNRDSDLGKPVKEQNPDIVLNVLDKGNGRIKRKRIPPVRAKKIGDLYDTNQIIEFA